MFLTFSQHGANMHFTPLHRAHAYRWDICLAGCCPRNSLSMCVFSFLSAPLVLIHHRWWWGALTARCALPPSILSTLCHKHAQAEHPHAPQSPPHNEPHLHLHADPSVHVRILAGLPVFNLSQWSYINKQCALSSLTHVHLIDIHNDITNRVYPPVWYRLLLSLRSSNQKWAVWVTVPLYEMERGSAYFH